MTTSTHFFQLPSVEKVNEDEESKANEVVPLGMQQRKKLVESQELSHQLKGPSLQPSPTHTPRGNDTTMDVDYEW